MLWASTYQQIKAGVQRALIYQRMHNGRWRRHQTRWVLHSRHASGSAVEDIGLTEVVVANYALRLWYWQMMQRGCRCALISPLSFACSLDISICVCHPLVLSPCDLPLFHPFFTPKYSPIPHRGTACGCATLASLTLLRLLVRSVLHAPSSRS